MLLTFSHFTTQFDWHTPVSPRIRYPEDIPSIRPLDTHTHTHFASPFSWSLSVSLGTTGSHSSNLLTCYSYRLWAERAQTVLQTRAQWLSARPPQDQEGLQLRSHHAGQSPQHTTADGSGHVYQRDRAQRYWSLLKWRSQIFSSTCGLQ